MRLSKLQTFPLGVPDFSSIIEDDLFFVDKTEKLGALVSIYRRVFFSRPRRMGKTTLCSTLEELFARGDSDKFVGMKIHGNWPEKRLFPVISLSFFDMDLRDASTFEAALCSRMIDAYLKAGFADAQQYSEVTSFNTLTIYLNALTAGKRLVILIDEWDNPLSSTLDKPQLFASLQLVLRNFYSWLRLQTNARFVLVTGIMRYRDTSLFTGSDIIDLSMNPAFADILGYTQEELDHKFYDYIDLAADKLGLTHNELLQQLKLYYDGFCFDCLASVKLYSPWSINQFFNALFNNSLLQDGHDGKEQLNFGTFWMNSSGAAPALRSYLNGYHGDIIKLAEKYSKPVVLGYWDMTSPMKAADVTLDQIMVQSGMLSIQAITEATKFASNVEDYQYECALTNYEVASQYKKVLVAYMLGQEEDIVKPHILKAHQSLGAGDIDGMCHDLNQLLVLNTRYDLFDEQSLEKEKVYRTLFRWCLLSDVVNTKDEVANNLGRCDLVATTNDTIYVFELKRVRTDTPKTAFSMLNKAEKQMEKNGYGNNLINQGKLVVWVVLVICDQYRQIRAWRTITKTKTATGIHIERKEALVELIALENQTVSSKATGKAVSSKASGNAVNSKATAKAASSKATAKATSSKATAKAASSKATAKATSSKAIGKSTSSKATAKAANSKATGKATSSKATGKTASSKVTGKAANSKATKPTAAGN